MLRETIRIARPKIAVQSHNLLLFIEPSPFIHGYLSLASIMTGSDGCSQDFEGILTAAKKAGLGSLPVDDLPNVFDIRRLAVEILWAGGSG